MAPEPSDDGQVRFPWESTQSVIAPRERIQQLLTKPLSTLKLSDEEERKPLTWFDKAAIVLPCLAWLRSYNVREWLLWDFIAGLSVGAMVVPQGLSYAQIAAVPSVYGLYGAFMPCIIYALFGSSKQLAVGPVAVTSLLIGQGMLDILPGAANIQNPNKLTPEQVPIQDLYNTKVIQIAFLVACMYTASGVLGLGWIITRFLSHPTIAGFTSGAAVIIGLSQVKFILGVSVARRDPVHEQLKDLIGQAGNIRWKEVVMGVTLMLMLIAFKLAGKSKNKVLKYIAPMGPLTACIVSISAVYIGKLDQNGIRTVANIPKGLPPVSIDKWFPMHDIGPMFQLAIIVMLVDLLESTSIARALAMKHGYKLNLFQEIVGLGLANFAGAMFNSYTTTGSFSRSAVNSSSGAKTPLAGFITAWVVGFVLLFLTPIFEKIPYNTLAAVIIVGVSSLFEWDYALQLFRVRLWDFLVFMTGLLCVMFLGVELGLAVSIGVSLLTVVLEAAFPHTAMLGHIEKTTTYRNLKQYPEARIIPGLLLVRVGAPLYFANVQWVEDKFRDYEKKAAKYSAEAGSRLRYVVWDLSPVNHMDMQGITLLEELHEYFASKDVQLVLTNPATGVVQAWEAAGLFKKLQRDWVFARVHDAVAACRGLLAEHESLKAEDGERSVELSARAHVRM